MDDIVSRTEDQEKTVEQPARANDPTIPKTKQRTVELPKDDAVKLVSGFGSKGKEFDVQEKENEKEKEKEAEQESDSNNSSPKINYSSAKMGSNVGMNAVASHVVRQVLRNLMLIMVSHHPNGIFDNQLAAEYTRITKQVLPMDDNIEYLFFNYRNVLITPCVNRGHLLTLHHQSIQSILEEYTALEITDVICGHVNSILKLFPCGISSAILDDVIFNFFGYRLSRILSHSQEFVTANCSVTAKKVEQSVIYFPTMNAEMNSTKQNPLSSPIGYRELFIALLIHHEKPMSIEELEREFRELFGLQLNVESPVINRMLKKINDPKLNQEQKELQLQLASNVRNEAKFSRSSLRSGLRSSFNSLKSMIKQFRLAPSFELHHEKNRALFEVICPKCRDMTNMIHKSPFEEDHKTVFMGGFANGTSVQELEEALAKHNVKLIDCNGISCRNYGWSFVKVETAQQAQKLVKCSPIQIRGRNVDVRPFIDRKRVKNHQQNRPPFDELLEAVLQAAHQSLSGLTVAQMQTKLFHKFQFRVDGPEITKLVINNPKLLQIKRYPIERIIPTPKMHRMTMKELKWKILKIFNVPTSNDDNSNDNQIEMDSNPNVNKTKILSLTDFENEFARRYKAFLEPRLYGYRTVYDLLQSMSDVLCFPRISSQPPMLQPQPQAQSQQLQQENGFMFGSWLATHSSVATANTSVSETNWIDSKNSTTFDASSMTAILSGANSNDANTNMVLKLNTPSTHQSMNLSNFPYLEVHPGPMPQVSHLEIPMALQTQTQENAWLVQDGSVDHHQFVFSNLGALSNHSLGSKPPQPRIQNNSNLGV